MQNNYLESAKKQFVEARSLGKKAIEQVPEEKLSWQYNSESNSITMIVNHMVGNMLSRFTDFLTTDGEKSWRNRDKEFENEYPAKEELLASWEKGWNCVFASLEPLTSEDLLKTVVIRNEKHTVMEAINRQLTHYAYHVGQIVFLGKMICDQNWHSLSIPRGHSGQFNADKFSGRK
jgi:uncharacterized damage-inducible protein DinB